MACRLQLFLCMRARVEQVAEAVCDVIDCVAAQHGQRIHMHYTDPRRTSFPSRPFASPSTYAPPPLP